FKDTQEPSNHCHAQGLEALKPTQLVNCSQPLAEIPGRAKGVVNNDHTFILQTLQGKIQTSHQAL
ncbi:hypothetical protein ACQP3F_34115, partial [Escherichia coli]